MVEILLLIDIGNTNIDLCVHDGVSPVFASEISSVNNVRKNFNRLIHTLKYNIKSAAITSVVPAHNKIISLLINEAFDITPIIINTSFKSDINICLENIETLGVDRFVNAVAAHALYKNENIIVIDFGTATTYDFIRATGDFEFGLICPGIGICVDALHEKTAQLPKVKFAVADSIVAKNTYSSILAGNFFSKIGEIEYIINRIKLELSQPIVKVVATGGYAEVVACGTSLIDTVNTNLIFEGMKILCGY